MMNKFSVLLAVVLMLLGGVSVQGQSAERLEIFPKEVRLKPGAKLNFSVVKYLDDGTVVMPENNVAWIATGGGVRPDGVFVAGTRSGFYAITVVHENMTATAQVQIAGGQAQPQRLRIITEAPVLAVGQKFQFKAEAVRAGGQIGKVKSEWSITGGGQIDSDGWFRAEREGEYFVVVRDANNRNNQAMVATTSVRIIKVNPVFPQNNPNLPLPNNNNQPFDPNGNNSNNNNNNQPEPNPQPQPQPKPIKVSLTKWDIGGGNFLTPWAKVEGKVEGGNLAYIEIVAIDYDGDERVMKRQEVKDGDTFKLHAKYERFATDKVKLRLVDKNGKVVAHRDEKT